ncbi:DNA-binding NarL/FixJ family response regulator [Pedobacter sp. UYP30]|uniref:response regulator transcription factor n=1 Tax=Pedobacter sp. UYP30 TaxID=1756400 RepID=UPI003394F4C2
MIRVILAEDHNIVRNGIKMLLESQPGISVVSEAANGQQVLDLINAGLEVDVVLADINMPQMDGIALIEELKSISPQTKLLILTMLDNDKYVAQAFGAGARGYLLKNLGEDELVFGIKAVHSGSRYICTELALRMLDELLKTNAQKKERSEIDFTVRELEVLHLIAEGYTNREMGEKLFLSKRTVEGHRQALLDKTSTKNTAMLIRFAYSCGYID